MIRSIPIILTILLFGMSSSAQTEQDDIEPYDYDTTLKGGYSISFIANDSMQYLYLKKGKKTISELASTSRGILYKSLGYVGADFTSYFVLVHSFGSGNPNEIELIRKTDAKNILSDGAAWIGADEKMEYLLYCEKGVPTQKDKMVLYNVRTNKKQFFNFPQDIFNQPAVLNRIEMSQLTDKALIITYDTDDGSKIKTYNRLQ